LVQTHQITEVRLLPEQTAIPFLYKEGRIQFQLLKLDTFLRVEALYEARSKESNVII